MTASDDTTTEPILSGRPARRSRIATATGGVSALAFFFVGLYLMGQAPVTAGAEFWLFLSGVLCCSFAFFIPLELLRWFEGT